MYNRTKQGQGIQSVIKIHIGNHIIKVDKYCQIHGTPSNDLHECVTGKQTVIAAHMGPFY